MGEKDVLVIDQETLQLALDKILGELAAQRTQDHEELMSAGAAINNILTTALAAGIELAKHASEQHVAMDAANAAGHSNRLDIEEANRHTERMYELETRRLSGAPEGDADRVEHLEAFARDSG